MLAVITGKNGSGKSHLFQSIANGSTSITIHDRPITKEQIKYIGFGQLIPKLSAAFDPQTLNQVANELWGYVVQANQTLTKSIAFNNSSHSQRSNQLFNAIKQNPKITKIIQQYQQNARRVGRSKRPLHKVELLEAFFKIENLELSKLSQSEFLSIVKKSNLPLNTENEDLFTAALSEIFMRYQMLWIENLNNRLYRDAGQHNLVTSTPLTEQEFIDKYSEPPWVSLDNALNKLELPYTVTTPKDLQAHAIFNCEFIHRTQNGVKVDSSHLSTGEKVLLSLILAIYVNDSIDTFKLLILDEPDAPLHPSMSKIMLELIEEEIVQKRGISVIMSTHSPASIACTPARYLFKMNATNRVTEKCTLEDATALLTEGFPSFSISVDNRRQVFVESFNDVTNHELLFSILFRDRSHPIQLQFIAPNNHKNNDTPNKHHTNCDDVKYLVETLRARGGSTYGLIDRDTDNQAKNGIVILGLGNRYTIENYILEPHFIGLALLDNRLITPAELGFPQYHNALDIKNAMHSTVNLQTLIDHVEKQLWGETLDQVECELVNGKVVKIHRQQLEMQGHPLEEKYKSVWGDKLMKIGNHRDKKERLKRCLINTVINELPGLLSKDILDTYLEFK
ncbi:AAA family ATPase [Aliivibrio fischeri]|uniref:AAA family ATPase n=1 Tax=Aliivibrio fischeri TaxID=668 RepID=UPI0012D962F6|nr:AAA family ATPase [Aliivibrio fischeri]MUK63278.1 AAA family ATPase [Aliivibrio fischeri]MUL20105.1 AAA family ATPase [Aliivibrio fischeri]MUL24968.1 AAA family ATPase [Aliivibrio fischeri]